MSDAKDVARDAVDAARYRWLRSQHWLDGQLAVVMNPKEAVKLGRADCPTLKRLDDAIDSAMALEKTE